MENQNQNPKQQLIERLKQANNVLVTVSQNPSVDQLSAAIGLTLLLNHLDKHATAVFSGNVPDTLEFLKPEETIEKNTDSLRDFIISLDKAKADKLRYKVEDKMVKIFITPYRTSLTEADLVFGQGDFNVDVVVAIGVQEKEDLDQAITSHGRILHDAVVATLNTVASGQLGSINWVDSKASSLSEMLVSVCQELKADALDSQMATAFLTGIVAETQRFSNEKTSSDTMNISAKLMSAGANQQLVATKLEQPTVIDSPPSEQGSGSNAETTSDGSLAIEHEEEGQHNNESADLPEVQPEHQDETAGEQPVENDNEQVDDRPSRLILQPPTLGGTLTANTKAEGLDPSTDPLTLPSTDSPILTHDKEQPVPDTPMPEQAEESKPEPEKTDVPMPTEPPAEPEPAPQPPVVTEMPPRDTPVPEEPKQEADNQTLSELEAAVDSPHLEEPKQPVEGASATPDADAALAAAHQAFDAAASDVPEKPAAFNAGGLMDVDHTQESPENAATSSESPETSAEPVEPPPVDVEIDPNTGMLRYPENLVPPSDGLPSDPTAATVSDPTAPPPVPPPMAMPPMMPPADPPISPDNLPPVNP